jgi:hypothetical protein
VPGNSSAGQLIPESIIGNPGTQGPFSKETKERRKGELKKRKGFGRLAKIDKAKSPEMDCIALRANTHTLTIRSMGG